MTSAVPLYYIIYIYYTLQLIYAQINNDDIISIQRKIENNSFISISGWPQSGTR